MVRHLKETGFRNVDSTTHWPPIGGVAPAQTVGIVGHGESFNGTTTFLDAGTVGGLGDAFTLSAWVNVSPVATNIQTIWANQQGGFGSAGFALFVNSYTTSDQKALLDTGDGTNGAEMATGGGRGESRPVWHQVSAAVNRTNGTVAFYVGRRGVRWRCRGDGFCKPGRLESGTLHQQRVLFQSALWTRRAFSPASNLRTDGLGGVGMTVASNSVLQNYSAVTLQTPALNAAGNGPWAKRSP